MQSKGEPAIVQTWRVQITPARYQINNSFQDYEYTCLQKINANSINLLNLSIICAFPNITFDYSTIRVRANGVEYLITIPKDKQNNFWDIFNICSILTTQFNAQTPHTWTFNPSGNNNAFILISANTTFNLVAGRGIQYNQIQRYLGFGDLLGLAYTQPPQNSWLSPFPYNVQVTNNINVQIRGVGELNSDSIAVLVQIPIQPVNTLISWQSPFYQYARNVINRFDPFPIQKLQISFLDDNSRPMIIQDNHVSMTLLCERFEKQ